MAPKARSKSAPKARGKSKAKAKPASRASSRSRHAASSEAVTPRSGANETATRDEQLVTPRCGANETATRDEKEPVAAAVETVPKGAPVETADPTQTAAATASGAGDPGTPPAQVTTPSARREQLEQNVEDPWVGLSDEEAYGRVINEAWDSVLQSHELPDGRPAHVIASKDSSDTCDREAWPRVAVSLDVSETRMERVDSLPALWLRNVNLGGNLLQSLDGLSELFPRLLSVDLSLVDLSSFSGAWDALALCRNLRAISAEGASVTSFEVMRRMERLESLELLENSVEELDEIEKLAACCPSLVRLDLRENPVVLEPGYAASIQEHLPLLTWHDNQSTKKYVAKTIDKCGYTNLNAEVNAVDGLYKNEHCSCLEGNPCIEKETCVDWENREAVAAEARKRKGLRDERGKQL